MIRRWAGPALSILLLAGGARAGIITGTGDPSDVISGTVVDFESTALGTYSSLSFTGVTITGADDAGQQMQVDNAFAGQFNTQGNSLNNGQGVGYQTLIFTFDAPVNAFAFLFGASDVNWQLTAYDSGNSVIETMTIPPVTGSNAGDYFGLSDPGIASATLTSSNSAFEDFVFVDNFTFGDAAAASVPEPGGLSLVVLALVSVLGFARKHLCKRG